jgi:hypothetical protein
MAGETNLKCERLIPEVHGLKDQEITVGRHVIFQCEGTWDKIFDFKKTEIKIDEASKYKLKVLKAEARSVSAFDVDMAFYSAGQYQFPDFILTDGTNEIHLGEQKVNVVSVIEKPKDPQQKPEPFGPVFPLKLAWPLSYTLFAATLIILLILYFAWGLRRRYKYIKLILKLKDYDSPIPADRQYYKALQKAAQTDYPLTDIEHAFRMYITRTYKIPAFDLSDRALDSFFKRRSPWFKKERIQIKKILEDFKLLKNVPPEKLKADKVLFIQTLYRFVEQSEEAVQKKAAK